MKILAIEKEVEGTTAEDFKPHLNAEVLIAWDYYKKGHYHQLCCR